MQTLTISSRAFWDVDFEKLMLEKDKYAAFIIRKVFENGTWADVIAVIKYYGKNTCTEILTKTEFLQPNAHHLSSAIFKIDKTTFRCYTSKQFRPSYTKH